MADDWDFLDRHGADGYGVGQYDAEWEQGVEAEWYMTGEHVETVQTNAATSSNNTDAAFAVRFWNASSTLAFPNVENLPARGTLTLQLGQLGAPRSVRPQSVSAVASNTTTSIHARVRTGAGAPDTSGGGALALYSQNRDGSRGALLATCACGGRLLARGRVHSCPFEFKAAPAFQGHRHESAVTDLLFAFEPEPSATAAVDADAALLLDSWSVHAKATKAVRQG